MVWTLSFEAVVTERKKNLFCQRMIGSVNRLDLKYQKYETNGNERYEIYEGQLIFTTNDFVLFGIDHQSNFSFFQLIVNLGGKTHGVGH